MHVENLIKAASEARMALAGALAGIAPSARQVHPRKVVFSSYLGAGYGCNPKYLAEALLRRAQEEGEQLDLVWLLRGYDPSIPAVIRQVKWGTAAAAKEWATAKVWVDNVRTRRHVAKKPGQFYLQTWHGCLSPKRLEADIEALLSPVYIKGAKQDSRDADLFVCNNDFFEEVVRRSFYYKGAIMRCGCPRNAPLLNPDAKDRQRIREKLRVPAQAKVCLYAPTFRDDGSLAVPTLDCAKLCHVLAARFGGRFTFVLRAHPNVARRAHALRRPGIIDASLFPDPIELLLAADVLVSDYSSLIEDFALLGRPSFQYVPDRASYEQTRGFSYPLESRPCPVAATEEALQDAILSYDEDTWKAKREGFFETVGFEDDGQGANLLAGLVLDKLRDGAQASAEDDREGA